MFLIVALLQIFFGMTLMKMPEIGKKMKEGVAGSSDESNSRSS